MHSRKAVLSGVFMVLTMVILSCASQKDDSDDHHHHDTEGEGVWKEMDEFHMIMAETFHPYKDSSNLEPAKTRASELMTAADEWASASLPGKVDNAAVRSKIQKLKADAASLAESVKSADDNVVAERLTALHDTFHEIQEAWYGSH